MSSFFCSFNTCVQETPRKEKRAERDPSPPGPGPHQPRELQPRSRNCGRVSPSAPRPAPAFPSVCPSTAARVLIFSFKSDQVTEGGKGFQQSIRRLLKQFRLEIIVAWARQVGSGKDNVCIIVRSILMQSQQDSPVNGMWNRGKIRKSMITSRFLA